MKKLVKSVLIGLVTGAVNGLFGSGGGTIAVPAMEKFLKEDEKDAHATAIAIILPLTLMSAFFYIKNDYADYWLTLKVTAGGVIGGFIGAILLNKCPKKLLRKLFGLFMIIAAVRMVWS